MTEKAIATTTSGQLSESHLAAIEAWAKGSTRPSARDHDLVRDKGKAILGFYDFTGKTPGDQVTAIDVQTWLNDLRNKGQSPSTVYGKASKLSAFYKWMIEQGLHKGYNPVEAVRPKAPKAYTSESTQALADSDVKALLGVVRRRARADTIGKRDYAMLLLYLLTGMRRAEVCGLRYGDLRIDPNSITIRARVKGGDMVNIELRDPSVRGALQDYLASGERELHSDSPLWVAFDFAKDGQGRQAGSALTSHAFVHNLKRYANEAGIGDIHLHQTRHTVARIVAEADGIKAAQEQLGHKSEQTTRVYVQRVGIRRDKHSSLLAETFGIDDE